MRNFISSSKFYLASLALTGSLLGAAVPVSAMASTPGNCGLWRGDTAPSLSVNGSSATASFTVPANRSNCEFSLVSYKSPAASGHPFNQQVIFQAQTGNFGPGRHSITVSVPNCFFQVDLYTGPAVNLQTSNPIPPSPWALVDHANGGAQSCNPVTPAQTPPANNTVINVSQTQTQTQTQTQPAETPAQPESTPAEPETQTQTQTPAAAPLPQTGPESAFAGLLGSGALGYAAMSFRRSRKALLDTLRK